METCVRGFSFMTESKTELQYIEDGELERTWRNTRRNRVKKREQNIWDNFVKEQDAVRGVCSDDPYQFLEPLPESCMHEIMEDEQPKLSREIAEEEARAKREHEKEQAQHSTTVNSSGEDVQHTCVVTFADDMDKDDCDMFHIFDDDQSGGEDEVLNENNGLDTVREQPLPPKADTVLEVEEPQEREIELQKSSSKSSENVASVIESSIYCARVKELRGKINEELLDLMTSLDRRDILLSSEPEDIARMVKRSAEFCTRFNRIYMYQLQRQIHDIKRNNSQTLPFAKHTQFQSQMGRIVTLHQNLLQAFMVFHKSFSQTCCVRESAGALGSLLAAVRDVTHMCLGVPPPKDFTACLDLYKDDLLPTCDKLDEFVNEYAIRCEEYLNRFETYTGVNSKKTKKETKVKRRSWSNRNTIKTGTESQLSMYSMDTVRMNTSKSSNTYKVSQLGKSPKLRFGTASSPTRNIYQAKVPDKITEPVKSPKRSRRPLMRDPHAGRPRAPKRTRENDIRTMVEAVEACTSSHMSGEDSPTTSRASKHSVKGRMRGPRHARAASPPQARSPAGRHARARPCGPAPLQLTLRLNAHESAQKKSHSSPRHAKLSPNSNLPSPSKPRRRAPAQKSKVPLKEVLTESSSKQEQDAEEQVIPVLTIKCAMKQDCKEEDGKQESSGREPSERENTDEKKKVPTEAQMQYVHYKYGECSTTVKKYNSPRTRSPNRSRMSSPTQLLQRELAMERVQEKAEKPDRMEVTRLLKQLCSGDGSSSRSERVSGNKNVQLIHVNGNSPRQASTPQLLRILEETIKKKLPKPLFQKPAPARPTDRYRLQFHINDKVADTLFQYRTKYVQHMLTSAMYANSAVGKPWEMIGIISEQIIDDVLLSCTSKMELRELISELYKKETC